MGIPDPGSKEYEEMVAFMRADLETDMGYSKIMEAARKSIEARGKNFQEEFEKWVKKGGNKVSDCIVCGNKVDWDLVKEEFPELLDQVDHYGVDSLTENQQVIYLGKCCSANCYDKLD
jgi:hypothetical protein